MEISFETTKLRRLCENSNYAIRRFGPKCATRLQRRLDDIVAANNVAELNAGKPHPLRGNRSGQLSISLIDGTRLVIQPSHDIIPKNKDGSIDWVAVTAVTVCYIGDYHD